MPALDVVDGGIQLGLEVAIIVFTKHLQVRGDANALSEILRKELPSGSEVIALGEGRFWILSNLENQIELRSLCELILDFAEEYDEEHPGNEIGAEASFKTFKDYASMEEALTAEG